MCGRWVVGFVPRGIGLHPDFAGGGDKGQDAQIAFTAQLAAVYAPLKVGLHLVDFVPVISGRY